MGRTSRLSGPSRTSRLSGPSRTSRPPPVNPMSRPSRPSPTSGTSPTNRTRARSRTRSPIRPRTGSPTRTRPPSSGRIQARLPTRTAPCSSSRTRPWTPPRTGPSRRVPPSPPYLTRPYVPSKPPSATRTPSPAYPLMTTGSQVRTHPTRTGSRTTGPQTSGHPTTPPTRPRGGTSGPRQAPARDARRGQACRYRRTGGRRSVRFRGRASGSTGHAGAATPDVGAAEPAGPQESVEPSSLSTHGPREALALVHTFVLRSGRDPGTASAVVEPVRALPLGAARPGHGRHATTGTRPAPRRARSRRRGGPAADRRTARRRPFPPWRRTRRCDRHARLSPSWKEAFRHGGPQRGPHGGAQEAARGTAHGGRAWRRSSLRVRALVRRDRRRESPGSRIRSSPGLPARVPRAVTSGVGECSPVTVAGPRRIRTGFLCCRRKWLRQSTTPREQPSTRC